MASVGRSSGHPLRGTSGTVGRVTDPLDPQARGAARPGDTLRWREGAVVGPPVRPPDWLDPDIGGPLTRDAALRLLDQGAQLLQSADFADAARHYRRVVGFDDPAVTAAALLGLGEAFHRLDRDDGALDAWQQVTALPETPSSYPAWRNVAAAKVRAGDLRGAFAAYREADRRAPIEDRPEIASRLGWLSKELGDQRGAGRYFARARGDAGLPLSAVIVGATVVVSLSAELSRAGGGILEALALIKPLVGEGEVWRLLTVTLVHGGLLHLFFNMYALWLAGPLVERLYGRPLFAVFYVVLAAAGSLATYALGPGAAAVGASGAIFGLFGLLLAVSRTHNPVLDRQGRMFLGQIGGLIVINLVIGFVIPNIDNVAHLGGLAAGLWLGFLIPPGRVQTLGSMWQRPDGAPGVSAIQAAGRLLGVVALLAVLVVLFVLGNGRWG